MHCRKAKGVQTSIGTETQACRSRTMSISTCEPSTPETAVRGEWSARRCFPKPHHLHAHMQHAAPLTHRHLSHDFVLRAELTELVRSAGVQRSMVR
jgi:hypothetical protein